MTKYWDPPFFFTQIFFYQIDSVWPNMDFKHNLEKCEILRLKVDFLIESKRKDLIKKKKKSVKFFTVGWGVKQKKFHGFKSDV